MKNSTLINEIYHGFIMKGGRARLAGFRKAGMIVRINASLRVAKRDSECE